MMRGGLPVFALLLALCGCGQFPVQFPGLPGAAAPVSGSIPVSALTGPTLQVDIPLRGASAPLSLAAVNGDVETWLAVDNISVSFRRGVLVASRGLGHDLMGAGAETTLAALAGAGEGIYRRQMRFLTGENRSTFLQAGCTMTDAGSEEGDGRGLRRFEETCLAHQHEFTNIFWIADDGTIVRSQQWLSPEVGYIVTRLIR